MTNGTIPPPPGAAPQKKGLPVLAWVGIGCLGLLFLGALTCVGVGYMAKKKVESTFKELEENPVATVGKAYALANPDIEFVSADESSGVITFRNTKTDETVTINYADIKDGRVSINTGEGSVTFGAGASNELPDWVPSYPGATRTGGFSADAGNNSGGTVILETDAGAQEVYDFYKSQLEAGGYEINTQSFSAGGTEQRTVTGASSSPKRTVTASITSQEGKTVITVVYGTEEN